MSKGKKFEIPTWLLILIILLLIFTPLGAAIKAGLIDFGSLFGLRVTDEDHVVEGPYVGTVTLKVNSVNVVDDGAESLTSSAFTAYHGAKGAGVGGLAVSASGTDFVIEDADDGIVYMKVYGGTAHYIVVSEMLASNKEIESSYWEDLDNDGLDDLVIKVNLADVQETTVGVKPQWTLVLPVVDEDVTGLTDDNPSDITSVGTTEVVKSITWDISGVSERAGFVIARLWFSTNATRSGEDIKFEEITVSGMGLDWGLTAPVFTQGGPNAGDLEAWYIKPDDYNDYHKGLMPIRWVNKADKLSITLQVRCTFESGDKVKVQLELEYLQAEGTLATLQDDVGLAA